LSENIQAFSKLCDLNVVEKDKTKIWMADWPELVMGTQTQTFKILRGPTALGMFPK
jgi:hypothetical protein